MFLKNKAIKFKLVDTFSFFFANSYASQALRVFTNSAQILQLCSIQCIKAESNTLIALIRFVNKNAINLFVANQIEAK